ncbi:DUF1294 domain-containing protein [Priestia megaterium]|nr:DUF1294 domain-containing protein [Priestia megaterium]
MSIISLYLFCINVIGLYIMKVDKRRAKRKEWRIQERTIWLIAVIGGAFGLTVGMHMYRHKTKHIAFLWGLPLLAIGETVLLLQYL